MNRRMNERKTLVELKKEYGTVDCGGTELYLLQHAYCFDKDTYRASAVDENDNEYTVSWNIEDFDCEDESDACNWDEYDVCDNHNGHWRNY